MNVLTDEQILLILGAKQISKRKIYIPTDVFDKGKFWVVGQKYIPLLEVQPITDLFESKGEKECKRVLKNIIKSHS